MKKKIGRTVNNMKTKIFEMMNVTLPEGFVVANDSDMKNHFGSTPLDYGFLNHDKGAAIGVVRTQTDLTDSMLEAQIGAYQQHYSRMVPGFQMGEMRISNKEKHNVAFMTYKSNGPTKDFYNLLALTSLGNKEVVFLFSCDMRDAIDFMYKFYGVLDSIVVNMD